MKAKKVILGFIFTLVVLSLACKHPAPLKVEGTALSNSVRVETGETLASP